MEALQPLNPPEDPNAVAGLILNAQITGRLDDELIASDGCATTLCSSLDLERELLWAFVQMMVTQLGCEASATKDALREIEAMID